MPGFAETQKLIEAAKLAVREAEKAVTLKQNEISELESEKTAIGYTPTEDEVLTGKDNSVSYDQYANATKQLDAAEEKIDSAKANLTKLQAEQNTSKNSYDKVKREYDDINSKIETPLATLEKEIETSDRNIESLDNDLKYLKQEFYNDTQNSQLEKAYDDYKKKQDNYRKAKRKLDNLRASGTATAEEIAAAESAYQDAMIRVDDAYDIYQAILTDEKNSADAIEKNLAAKETELKYALKDNTDLKAKLEETKELDKQLKAKKVELDKTESTYNTATDKVNAAQTTYDNAVADKEVLTKSLEKVRNGYKYVKYKDYEARIETEKTNLENLNITLENEKEKLSDLQSQGSDSEESLKERVKTLERQLLTSTRELEQSIARRRRQEQRAGVGTGKEEEGNRQGCQGNYQARRKIYVCRGACTRLRRYRFDQRHDRSENAAGCDFVRDRPCRARLQDDHDGHPRAGRKAPHGFYGGNYQLHSLRLDHDGYSCRYQE